MIRTGTARSAHNVKKVAINKPTLLGWKKASSSTKNPPTIAAYSRNFFK